METVEERGQAGLSHSLLWLPSGGLWASNSEATTVCSLIRQEAFFRRSAARHLGTPGPCGCLQELPQQRAGVLAS